MKYLLCITLILLTAFGSYAQLAQTQTQPQDNTIILSDSLLGLMEARINSEYGISYNSTLEQTAQEMSLDIKLLKKQLNLDADNDKLDKMRLRQLGINVYQVLLAQETIQYGFNETFTLLQISTQFSIPVKKLKSTLGLDPNDATLNNRTIQSLGKSIDDILKAKQHFKDTLAKTGNNIILVGMLVVFIALLITSIVILQLRHLNAVTSDKIEQPGAKAKLMGIHPSVTANDIVAVITALQLHKKQIEDRKHIILTFHRANANYWHASGLYAMPNRSFNRKS